MKNIKLFIKIHHLTVNMNICHHYKESMHYFIKCVSHYVYWFSSWYLTICYLALFTLNDPAVTDNIFLGAVSVTSVTLCSRCNSMAQNKLQGLVSKWANQMSCAGPLICQKHPTVAKENFLFLICLLRLTKCTPQSPPLKDLGCQGLTLYYYYVSKSPCQYVSTILQLNILE